MAYSDSDKKGGAGKGNWGVPGQEDGPLPIDKRVRFPNSPRFAEVWLQQVFVLLLAHAFSHSLSHGLISYGLCVQDPNYDSSDEK
jgi:hypothetical protein